MTKKISCRVIRTAPLTKSSELSLRTTQSNNKLGSTADGTVENVRSGHNRNLFTYTALSHAAGVSIDDDSLGQILDCYV